MKTLFAAAAAATLITFTACGNKENTATQAAESETNTVAPSGPMESASPLLRTDTLRTGGAALVVSVERRTGKDLPTVRDENNEEFYDNSVEITARKDGEVVLTRLITKSDFDSYLGADEKRMGVLQGMALVPEKSSARSLTFGAQVGQPGLDGEGPAFTVVLNLEDGAISISKDHNQDTTRDDMTGDED